MTELTLEDFPIGRVFIDSEGDFCKVTSVDNISERVYLNFYCNQASYEDDLYDGQDSYSLYILIEMSNNGYLSFVNDIIPTKWRSYYTNQ